MHTTRLEHSEILLQIQIKAKFIFRNVSIKPMYLMPRTKLLHAICVFNGVCIGCIGALSRAALRGRQEKSTPDHKILNDLK